jgi:hypothetical protein
MPLTKVRGAGIGQVTSALDLKRSSSNGDVIELSKDSTAVGNIGVVTTSGGVRPYISAEGSHGVYLDSAGNNFNPATASGSDNDNAIDLGASFARWKDLYLSGGVHLGGTGASNELDYYEEGTWIPSFVGATNQGTNYNKVGRYTRIGRLVVIQFFYQVGATRPTFSNNASVFYVSGIPFSVASSGYSGSQGSVNAQAFNYTNTYNNQGMTADYLSASINGSEQLFFTTTNSGQTRGFVNNLSANSSHWIVEATVSYFTDA